MLVHWTVAMRITGLKRLRKTAMSLPTKVVKDAVMDMHRRVRKVVAAEGGGLFTE